MFAAHEHAFPGGLAAEIQETKKKISYPQLDQYYKIINEYASKHTDTLVLRAPQMLLSGEFSQAQHSTYEFFSTIPLYHMNNLANIFFIKTVSPYIKLKTNIPYKDFAIDIEGITLVRMYYISYIFSALLSPTNWLANSSIRICDADTESLILAEKLYAVHAFAEWDSTLATLKKYVEYSYKIMKHDKKINEVLDKFLHRKHSETISDLAVKCVQRAVDPDPEKFIVVRMPTSMFEGYCVLNTNKILCTDVVQTTEMIVKVLKKTNIKYFANLKVSYNDVPIPKQYRFKRAKITSEKMPILEIYNNLSFEIVPYVVEKMPHTSANAHIRVLPKFILFEIFSARQAYAYYKNEKLTVLHEILMRVLQQVVNSEELATSYPSTFSGTYYPESLYLMNLKNQAIFKGEGFFPYSPMQTFKNTRTLRIIPKTFLSNQAKK